jgi:hypothetical protein
MKSSRSFTVTLAISLLFNFLTVTKAQSCTTEEGLDGECMDVGDCYDAGGIGSVHGDCPILEVSTSSFINEADKY